MHYAGHRIARAGTRTYRNLRSVLALLTVVVFLSGLVNTLSATSGDHWSGIDSQIRLMLR